MSHFTLLPQRPGAASGQVAPPRSAFLASAWRRMAYALAAATALWALTGWALDWWPR
jgi:fatty acid desaturase